MGPLTVRHTWWETILAYVVLCTLTICLQGRADGADRVIPLKDIWALDMPGTRSMNRTMRGDPPAYVAPEGRLVDEIRSALKYDPRKHAVAAEAFAVRGAGRDALREAYAVLVQGRAKRASFREDEKISLVFFSYLFSSYVHLVRVEQRSNSIQLSYRFVPHETREVTAHIALIPISNPGCGTIRVEVKPEIDATVPGRDWDRWARRIVARSFTFRVSGSGD